MIGARRSGAALLLLAMPALAQPVPLATPAPGLVEAVAAAPSLATLARLIAAAELAPWLAGPAPVTLFAPTDQAWGRLAPGTLDRLLLAENRPALVRLLRIHLVPGRLTAADLHARIAAGQGRATLVTVQGEALTLTLVRGVVSLTDRAGHVAYLETPDLAARTGLIHRVNGVLVPETR